MLRSHFQRCQSMLAWSRAWGPAAIQYNTEVYSPEEGFSVDGVQERKRERVGAGTKYPFKDISIMVYIPQLGLVSYRLHPFLIVDQMTVFGAAMSTPSLGDLCSCECDVWVLKPGKVVVLTGQRVPFFAHLREIVPTWSANRSSYHQTATDSGYWVGRSVRARCSQVSI